MSDPRTIPVVLLRFYDDDHGPCASYTADMSGAPVTLPVDGLGAAQELTVELVLPEPVGLAGAADAEVLEAADRLIGNMGEAGSHITTTRSVLAMAADRAREPGAHTGHPARSGDPA